MGSRVNRREEILEAATRLFMQHGYKATSVRQIAEEVGCTEAALYYHFKHGKRALFGAVIEASMPDLIAIVDDCRDVASLHAFIVRLGHGLLCVAQERMITRLRWIMAEFGSLSEEERCMLYERHFRFREGLVEQIRRFVDDEAEACQIAWTLLFVVFGYGQLMLNLNMESVVDFDRDAFLESLANSLACGR
jgi:AcrR family transcriptional regulator